MAISTSASYNLKRNEIISEALERVRMVGVGDEPTLAQLDSAIRKLNLILREEDLAGTGNEKHLWALKTKHLFLVANQFSYTTSTADGLPDDILELVTAWFRDSAGDDTQVDIYSREAYETIVEKSEAADPTAIYLESARLLADQILHVNFAPSSISTQSEVIGSDGKNYKCILDHTSATVSQPISGGSWRTYWQEGGTAGTAWVTATAYTHGESLRLTYKRPLFNFTSHTENPDMPLGWDRYLVLRLAYDLAPSAGIALDERQSIGRDYRTAMETIFPSRRAKTTTPHNKVIYY